MKEFLVDVPVRINIWIRPECQRRQFEVIKQARPSILFIQSDGGRNEKEWEAIRQNRELIDNGIDWDCKVYKFYEDHNNGLYAMSKKTTSFIWNTVDRCIFTEDDQIPSVSFFRFCAELLEKYKDDPRIECICGRNHLGVYDEPQSDYFFSREGSIWGAATWRRVAQDRGDFGYINDPYIMKLLKQRTRRDKIVWERICNYPINNNFQGHVAGGEFWLKFNIYAQNRLQIIPTKNMINNIGCTADSEHSTEFKCLPRSARRIFNMQTYEYDFPLKHPKYVIPDVFYEEKRNKIMAYNKPFLRFIRDIEKTFLMIKHGKIQALLNKIVKRRQRNKSDKIVEK